MTAIGSGDAWRGLGGPAAAPGARRDAGTGKDFGTGCRAAAGRETAAGPGGAGGETPPVSAARQARRRRGARAWATGQAAEAAVARHYEAAGHAIAARRWRGRGGEIDLIAREGDTVVFIEVKQARTLDLAAERLGAPQMARIASAAEEFLGTEPLGQCSAARFDVALVDGTGRIRVLENVFLDTGCAA